MGEQAPTPSTEIQPPAVAVIGGLLTIKRLAFWYRGILKDDTTDIPPDDRFVAPHARGICDPDEQQKRTTERLEEIHERLDRRKVLLVGHSLGGLISTRMAMERPDLVDGVVSLGGAHSGYSRETLATLCLRYALGNPDEGRHLKHDSPFMQEHQEKMASEWPAGVPLHIISSPNDVLVVTPHGLNVELPEGQKAEKRIVVSPSPFGVTERVTRRVLSIPEDVQPITTLRPCEHLNMPRIPAVQRYVHEQQGVPTRINTADNTPSISPVALPAAA